MCGIITKHENCILTSGSRSTHELHSQVTAWRANFTPKAVTAIIRHPPNSMTNPMIFGIFLRVVADNLFCKIRPKPLSLKANIFLSMGAKIPQRPIPMAIAPVIYWTKICFSKIILSCDSLNEGTMDNARHICQRYSSFCESKAGLPEAARKVPTVAALGMRSGYRA